MQLDTHHNYDEYRVCKVTKSDRGLNLIEYNGETINYTLIDKNGRNIVLDDEFYLNILKDKQGKILKIIPFKKDPELVNLFLNNLKLHENHNGPKYVKVSNDVIFEFSLNSHLFQVDLKSYQISNDIILDENIKLEYVLNYKTGYYEIVQNWTNYRPSNVSFDRVYNVEKIVTEESEFSHYYLKELNYNFRFPIQESELSKVIIERISDKGNLILTSANKSYFISPSELSKINLVKYVDNNIFNEERALIRDQIAERNNNYILSMSNYFSNLFELKLLNKDVEGIDEFIDLAVELSEGALRHKYYKLFGVDNGAKIENTLRKNLQRYRSYKAVTASRVLRNLGHAFEESENFAQDKEAIRVLLNLSNDQFFTELEIKNWLEGLVDSNQDLSFIGDYVHRKVDLIYEKLSKLNTASKVKIREIIAGMYSTTRARIFDLYFQKGFSQLGEKSDVNDVRYLFRIIVLKYYCDSVLTNNLIDPRLIYDLEKLNEVTYRIEGNILGWKYLTPRANYISRKGTLEFYLKGGKLVANISNNRHSLILNQFKDKYDVDIDTREIANMNRFSIRKIDCKSFNGDNASAVRNLNVGEELDISVIVRDSQYFSENNKSMVFCNVCIDDDDVVSCVLSLNGTWINQHNRLGQYEVIQDGNIIDVTLKRIPDKSGKVRYSARLLEKSYYMRNVESEIVNNTEYSVIGYSNVSADIYWNTLPSSLGDSDLVQYQCRHCNSEGLLDLREGKYFCPECNSGNSIYLVLKPLGSQKVVYLTWHILKYYTSSFNILSLFQELRLGNTLIYNNGSISLIRREDDIRPSFEPAMFTSMILYNAELNVEKSSLWEGLALFAGALKTPNSYLYRLYFLASRLLESLAKNGITEDIKLEYSENLERIKLDTNKFLDAHVSIESIYLLEYLWKDMDETLFDKIKSEVHEISKISELILLFKLFSNQFPLDKAAYLKIIDPIKNFIFHQVDNQSLELQSGKSQKETSLIERILNGEIIEDEFHEFKETLWMPVLNSEKYLKIEELNLKLKDESISEEKRKKLLEVIKNEYKVDTSKEMQRKVKLSTFKNICAMLNTRGGVIVIGIRDIKGRTCEAVGLTADYSDTVKDFDSLIGVYQSAGKYFIKDWVKKWSQFCHPKRHVYKEREFLVITIDPVSAKEKDLCFISTAESQGAYIRTSHGAEQLAVMDIREYKRPKTAADDVQEASVYLMSSASTWKIGMSSDPEKRFGTLTPDVRNLKLEYSALFSNRNDAFEMERYLHKKYETKRDAGTREFFYLSQNDVQEIKSILETQIHVNDIIDYNLD